MDATQRRESERRSSMDVEVRRSIDLTLPEHTRMVMSVIVRVIVREHEAKFRPALVAYRLYQGVQLRNADQRIRHGNARMSLQAYVGPKLRRCSPDGKRLKFERVQHDGEVPPS